MDALLYVSYVPCLPNVPLSRLIHIVVKDRHCRVVIRQSSGETFQQVAEVHLLFDPKSTTKAPDDSKQKQPLHVVLREDFSCFRIALCTVQGLGKMS